MTLRITEATLARTANEMAIAINLFVKKQEAAGVSGPVFETVNMGDDVDSVITGENISAASDVPAPKTLLDAWTRYVQSNHVSTEVPVAPSSLSRWRFILKSELKKERDK
jgi:hypothetical protein